MCAETGVVTIGKPGDDKESFLYDNYDCRPECDVRIGEK